METKTYVALGAGVLLVLWLMQKRPKSVITLPSEDPAEGAGHDPYQNTTNNASTSNPTIDVQPPAPLVTASGAEPINKVSVSINTTRTAAPAASVSSKDADAVRDRVYVAPGTFQKAAQKSAASLTRNSGYSSITAAAIKAEQKRQEEQNIEIIGIPNMIWG